MKDRMGHLADQAAREAAQLDVFDLLKMRCAFGCKLDREEVRVEALPATPTGVSVTPKAWYRIACSCGATGPLGETPEEAADRWNARPRDLLGLLDDAFQQIDENLESLGHPGDSPARAKAASSRSFIGEVRRVGL